MKRRELLVGLAAAAIAEGCTSQRPGSVQQTQTPESQARYTNQIALPKPSVTGTISLEEAIERRRSMRRFGPDVLPVGTIGQASVGAAPVIIVVAAEPGRLSERYGGKADLYADLEVGHAAQNMLLQAVVHGLGAVPVGSFDEPRVARTLALPPGQIVVYLIPVGFAA